MHVIVSWLRRNKRWPRLTFHGFATTLFAKGGLDVSIFRFLLGVLIALSLAATPVVAAMAMPAVAAEHCAKKDMSDCPGCDKGTACQASQCAAKCSKAQPSSLEAPVRTFDAFSRTFPRAENEAALFRSWPPPAPPPRS